MASLAVSRVNQDVGCTQSIAALIASSSSSSSSSSTLGPPSPPEITNKEEPHCDTCALAASKFAKSTPPFRPQRQYPRHLDLDDYLTMFGLNTVPNQLLLKQVFELLLAAFDCEARTTYITRLETVARSHQHHRRQVGPRADGRSGGSAHQLWG
jgi:hypothetical protein